MRKWSRKWHNTFDQRLFTPLGSYVSFEVLMKNIDPFFRKVDICFYSQSVAYIFRELVNCPEAHPLNYVFRERFGEKF